MGGRMCAVRRPERGEGEKEGKRGDRKNEGAGELDRKRAEERRVRKRGGKEEIG